MDWMILCLFAVTAFGAGATAATNWTGRIPFGGLYTPSPERYNFFDTELLQVMNRAGTGNVVVSPLSVKLALGLLADGADGASAEEIRAALRLPADGAAARRELQQRLQAVKRDTSPGSLRLASRVFISDGYSIDPEYEQMVKGTYGSAVSRVSSRSQSAVAAEVNTWVAQETSGLIRRIADEGSVRPGAGLILANAVYFRGKWEQPFAREKTVASCFRTETGECAEAQMMSRTGFHKYSYVARLDAEVINLPYKGGRYSLVLVLPRTYRGSDQVSRDLAHVNLEDVLAELGEREVFVKVPRFAIETDVDLVPHLKALQVLRVFTPAADLSGIAAPAVGAAPSGRLAVGNVFHSAKIVVDEEGTEAAAATGAVVVPLMGGTPDSFIADRPFFFFLRDNLTGTTLFSGRVRVPVADKDHPAVTPRILDPHIYRGRLDPISFSAVGNYGATTRRVPSAGAIQEKLGRGNLAIPVGRPSQVPYGYVRNQETSGYQEPIRFLPFGRTDLGYRTGR